MSARLRQIVLDFDGVIADGTNRAYIEAYTDAVRAAGAEMADAEIEAGILRHWGESPRRELAGVLGQSHPALDAALSHYLAHIDERLLERARPLSGALEAVNHLAACYPLYLISGMGETPLNSIVQRFGLQHCFRAVISTSDSDRPERQKATGYHLRQLCQRQGLDRAETLCVGDAKSDVAMARSCGIPVAVVLSGALDRRAALELEVAWLLPALSALPDFLQRNAWPPGA
jgi:phosphoglycolate phosphatase-like HAD superfamily hydrolase